MVLNQSQQNAVNFFNGAALVVAGAGCGKTRVLTTRIKKLIFDHGVDPSSIVALTFTNKAAKEMLERVEKDLAAESFSLRQKPFLGTFHSYCFYLLKRYKQVFGLEDFSVLDGTDQQNLVRKILTKYSLQKEYQVRRLLAYFSTIRTNVQNNFTLNKVDSKQDELFFEYQSEKERCNSLDFDDLMVIVYKKLKKDQDFLILLQSKINHFLIDEYQDTSVLQHDLVRTIAQKADGKLSVSSIFAVGDQDQSIYSWRGAMAENVDRFIKDFAPVEIFKIEQNYRSAQQILSAANDVIKNNRQRQDKLLWSQDKADQCIFVAACKNEYQEANVVVSGLKEFVAINPSSEVAVLYRNHSQSRLLEEALIQAQMRYEIVGGLRFYERKEIKDLLAYLKLLVNPKDIISLERILNVPTRGLGDKVVEVIDQLRAQKSYDHFEPLLTDASAQLSLSRHKEGLAKFIALYKDKTLSENLPSDVLEYFLQQINYAEYLAKEYDSEELEAKMKNIWELKKSIFKFEQKFEGQPNVQSFLEEIALVQDVEQQVDQNASVVKLMTLHGAKGLEFDFVSIIGLEDGNFPSVRKEILEQEEERRLMYVGITRAKSKLLLTFSHQRSDYGKSMLFDASRFVNEIPSVLKLESSDNKIDFRIVNHVLQWIKGVFKASAAQFKPVFKSLTPKFESQAATPKVSGFSKNSLVRHEIFGLGMVKDVFKDTQGEVLEVSFRAGIKKIAANFVKKV